MDEDDDDYDEEEAEHPTWVEALTQEVAEDDPPEEDPDYEVGDAPACSVLGLLTLCCSCCHLESCPPLHPVFPAQHRRYGE